MKTLLTVITSVLLFGCSATAPQPRGYVVSVAPQQADCVGVGPMKCLVVDGELFYSPIQGFNFVPGYHYQLRIERQEAFPDGQIPMDANRYRYQLLEVISTTAADSNQ